MGEPLAYSSAVTGRARYHPFSIACLLMGLAGSPVMLFLWQFVPEGLGCIVNMLVVLAPGVVTSVFGILALTKIYAEPGRWRGRVFCFLGSLLAVGWLVVPVLVGIQVVRSI